MNREKISQSRLMSEIVVEMRDAIIELAGDRDVFDSRALWLERAARRAGITARMAKRLFYGECADPKASVVESVRGAVRRKNLSDAELSNAARNQYDEMSDKIARLEHALRVAAPNAYRAYIDAEGAARGEGHRAVD